ncbi:hypothetical protein GCM10008018_72500 [Paenibacillus marchantiophytorum]|uniref:Uncharacterized protein n=1 Tax=Paenibacillus marchantiophytorum TaxID=1619310 RepID=A0ABQ1FKI5_9BACL|nr:hypothetical protein [Paenibacillus marchantiophytorum]GGA17933.1 hypothetical protein GCM10008018_72500 [Paenibacillus marchantiophytorum]
MQASAAIQAILAGHRVEQQGFKACMGVLKLADRYSLVRLESACARALSYTPSPSYKQISTVLKSGQDTLEEAATIEQPSPPSVSPHGFTHGSTYYGRKS